MSISSPLTLDDYSGDAMTFQRLSTVAGGSEWIRSDSNLTEPIRMAIRHSVQGSGVNTVDRHLVQFSLTKLDSAGVPRTATVNLTVSFPRSAAISTTNVKDIVAHAVNAVTDNQLTSGITASTSLDDLFIGVM
jgi:hypothetical protein